MTYSFFDNQSAVTYNRAGSLNTLSFPAIITDDPLDFVRHIVGQRVAGEWDIMAVTLRFTPGENRYFPIIHLMHNEVANRSIAWSAAKVTLDPVNYRVSVVDAGYDLDRMSGILVQNWSNMAEVTVYGIPVTDRTRSAVPRIDRSTLTATLDLTRLPAGMSVAKDVEEEVQAVRSVGPVFTLTTAMNVGQAVVTREEISLRLESWYLKGLLDLTPEPMLHFGLDGVGTARANQNGTQFEFSDVYSVVLHGLWVDPIALPVPDQQDGIESVAGLYEHAIPKDLARPLPYYNPGPLAYLTYLRLLGEHDLVPYARFDPKALKLPLRNNILDIDTLYDLNRDVFSHDEWVGLVPFITLANVHKFYDAYKARGVSHITHPYDWFMAVYVHPEQARVDMERRQDEAIRNAAAAEVERLESAARAGTNSASPMSPHLASTGREGLDSERENHLMRVAYSSYRAVPAPAGGRHLLFGQFRERMVDLGYSGRSEPEMNNIGRGFNEFIRAI